MTMPGPGNSALIVTASPGSEHRNISCCVAVIGLTGRRAGLQLREDIIIPPIILCSPHLWQQPLQEERVGGLQGPGSQDATPGQRGHGGCGRGSLLPTRALAGLAHKLGTSGVCPAPPPHCHLWTGGPSPGRAGDDAGEMQSEGGGIPVARGHPRGPTLVRGDGPRTRETAGSDGRCQAAGGSGPWRRTPGSLAGGGRRLVRPPQPGSGLAKRRQPSKRIPPCYATGVGEDGPRPAKTSAPLQGVTSSGPARGRRREAGGGGKGSALGGQPGPSATPTPRGHGEAFHGLLPSPARLGAPTKPCELGRGVVGRRHAQGALETRPLGSRVGRPAGPAVSYTTGCHEKLTVLSIRCRLGFGEGKDPPGVPQSCQSPKDEPNGRSNRGCAPLPQEGL